RFNLVVPHPILASRFRNKIASVDRPIDQSGALEPVTITSRDGALIYRRSLCFLLVRAISELFPDLRVYINHSLDQGYYCEVYCEEYHREGQIILSQSDIERIEARMREYVTNNEKIERVEYPLKKAIALFEKAGMPDKVALLSTSPSETV